MCPEEHAQFKVIIFKKLLEIISEKLGVTHAVCGVLVQGILLTQFAMM